MTGVQTCALPILFVGCDKRSKLQGGVPARAIIEVSRRPRGSQISAPAHRERYSARLSHPTNKFTASKRKATIHFSSSATQGGKTGDPITLPDVLLVTAEGKPNFANIASCAVQRGETIVVDDARAETEFDFSGTRSFDEMLGYRSTSFLSVPLKTMSDESIGVLQDRKSVVRERV